MKRANEREREKEQVGEGKEREHSRGKVVEMSVRGCYPFFEIFAIQII